jgi:anaerobic C4-dicarboxylate transporter DcuA/anaerobic C4-dicarboxylate transporter DcuB
VNSNLVIILEGLVVLVAIALGVRYKGMSIGLFGGLGVLVLAVLFGEAPGSLPTTAIFIILSVVTAAAAMQVAGGVDWMVSIARRWITRRPASITYVAPAVSALFTMGAGTGNIYFSLLPVIEEVSYENGVRPERPLAVSPTTAQASLTASPVSSAMAAMVGIMATQGFELIDIMIMTVPALIVGVLVTSFVFSHRGKELEDDPEFQALLASGEIKAPKVVEEHDGGPLPSTARRSAAIFLLGVVVIIVLGLFDEIRPQVPDADGVNGPLDMSTLIQLIMLGVAALIIVVCKVAPKKVSKTTIFQAGTVSLIALFGVSWVANTFIEANQEALVSGLGDLVDGAPILMAVAIFAMAALTTSQTSTTLTMIPLGLALGVAPWMMVAMWPAVTGIYTFPINGSQIATMEFDRSGTTKIGRFVLNHSFLPAAVIMVVASVLTGLLVGWILHG